MSFYLGIDLGTSYFKSGIFNKNGKIVGLGRCAVEKQDNGVICELPIVTFWATLRECVSQAIEKAGINPNKIESLSYSSQANSFVLLDESNNPLTPLILWPDTRAEKMPTEFQRVIERDDFQQKTGLGIKPGIQSMAAKLIWFQQNQTEISRKVKSVMSISDFLIFSLTDKKISDFSTSSMIGMFDVSERKWWNEALELLNINENYLSFPKRSGTYVGTLTEKGAKRIGLSVETEFFLGALDHHMVAVGADLLDSNNISESTGTVLACVNYKKGYKPQAGINIAPGLKKDYFFQMAFNENGATALEWYQKNFASELSILELLKLAEKIEPGCDGLKAAPCADKFEGLSGFQNLREEHSHGHFVRAILESTSNSLGDLTSSLDKENLSEAIISSGGGAQSPLWIQTKADMLNKTFMLPECSELACLGAAKIALMGVTETGEKRSVVTQKSSFQVIKPNIRNVQKYKLEKIK